MSKDRKDVKVKEKIKEDEIMRIECLLRELFLSKPPKKITIIIEYQ